MASPTSRTTVIVDEPFNLPGIPEVLPAGAYDLQTDIAAPPDHLDADRWKASVLVQMRLQPRPSRPGLARSLTVPLSALEQALGQDRQTGGDLVDFFVEAMLADPMVQLVMRADRVSADEIRTLYARGTPPGPPGAAPAPGRANGQAALDRRAVQDAENEGMPPQPR